jgi:hypothetical protein
MFGMQSIISRVRSSAMATPFSVPSVFFSKYLPKSRTKRLPLSTKKAGSGYYKGNGCRKEGRLTSKGKFVLNREMCTELVVPDLTGFKLKPYIGVGAKRNQI